MHAPLTAGTFTVSGKTFNISSLDITLGDLLSINEENAGVSGINPEGDAYWYYF